MIRYTTPQNIIICDTSAEFSSLEGIPDGIRVICEENSKAYVFVGGQPVDLTGGGSFTGTLDLMFNSEVAASAATIMTGTTLTLTKVV